MLNWVKDNADIPQIMVVDDTLANLRVLSDILVNNGYHVRPATNGMLALKSVAVEPPDLILLDVNMPEMNGYEVCQHLKADDFNCKIPVIFISARDDIMDKIKGFNVGGVDYITKPFQRQEVLARVQTHLSLYRLQRQLEAQNLQLQHEVIIRKQTEEELRLNLKRLETLILQHRKAEEKLRLSEERFCKIFHHSPVMMSIRTPDEEVYIDVNSRWEEITGYSRYEVVGHSINDLGFWKDAVYWTEPINEYKVKGVKMNAERLITTKSGEVRTFLLSQTIVNLNNEECWLSAGVDITERKKMEQEMARLDRLNLVGEMAASIGHEIRNPMTSVRGFLQMFENKYSEDKEFLNLMIEELDRANAIITEFLSLAKNKIVELIPQDLNLILKNILPLVQASAMIQDKCIKMNLENVPDLLLDQKEIRQLILNLVHNGLESMSTGGIMIIRTYKEGDSVVLSVRDQGHGMDPEVLDKLGTPFFTTKEQGTGLGLAVCYGIASRHGASIEIKTGNKGTTVSIRFPV